MRSHPVIATLLILNLLVALGWAAFGFNLRLLTRSQERAQKQKIVSVYRRVAGFSTAEARTFDELSRRAGLERRLSVEEIRFILQMISLDVQVVTKEVVTQYMRNFMIVHIFEKLRSVPDIVKEETVATMMSLVRVTPVMFEDMGARSALVVAFKYATASERAVLMAERAAATGLRRKSYDYAYKEYTEGFPEPSRRGGVPR